jgi:hypothetical protein
MNSGGLSAGTGPAAALLIGGVIYLAGEHFFGILLMLSGIGLSLLWSGRFR